MKEKGVIVSVCMITYNHEKFISQAIEGALMQKTDFPIELIIGEDCSTDRTREICVEYQQKHPEIIKLQLPEKNMGMIPNFITTLSVCAGKYIALCEGDDYWTDPCKLQKQVDFLKKNVEYVLCFHKVKIDSMNQTDQALFTTCEEREYSSYEIYDKWTIPTCSVVFRNIIDKIKWHENVVFGDIFLFLSLMEYGKAYCYDFMGGVYRKHPTGMTINMNYSLFEKLFFQYQYMIKRFPELAVISTRNKNYYLDHLVNVPISKVNWKYLLYKMRQNPQLFFRKYIDKVLNHKIKTKKTNKYG
jgi:glycosyltransferase involved in cell wall biosynthesis